MYNFSLFDCIIDKRADYYKNWERDLWVWFRDNHSESNQWLIILCVGRGLHLFIEAILFYLIFVSLRFFCGGYHANSYTRCFLSLSLTSGLCLIVAKWISKYENTVIILFVIATTALGICIFRLAPVEHENRLLTQEEKKIFRKRSIQLYVFWSVIGIVLWQAQLMAV